MIAAPSRAIITGLALLAAACASSDDKSQGSQDASQAPQPNQGYVWAGEGQPGNFGSAYSFCRSVQGSESQGQAMQGAAGTVTSVPGGPNVIPGYERSSVVPQRGNYTAKLSFQDCMRGQGWTRSEPPMPNPPGW